MILALIEVKARLVAAERIDDVVEPVFLDRHACSRRLFPGHEACDFRQPFERAHRVVTAFEDAAAGDLGFQGGVDPVEMTVDAGRQCLHHEPLAVLIDDQAGKLVGLARYEPGRRLR